MKRFRPVILALALLLPAARLEAQPGSSGLTFLKLGVGARALAMGEAATATGDPEAGFYNPAALAFAAVPEIMLMHKQWFQDVTTEYLAAQAILGGIHLGVSVNSTSVANIELREIPGPAVGTFDARNAAIGLTAAYRVDTSFAVGITGKFLYEKILVDEASGTGFDLGVAYTTPWNLRLGASAENLGSMNALRDESSLLPTIFRAGAAYAMDAPTLSGMVTVAADIVRFSRDGTSHLHLGGEYLYNSSLAIRAGYQGGYETRSFTTGIGLHYSILQLDYAFVPTQYDLGSAHTFSLSIQFP